MSKKVYFLISLAFGLIVFLSGSLFSNPAHSFYAGFVVFLSGVFLIPLLENATQKKS